MSKEIAVGSTVLVRPDIDEPDPKYVNRTGTVVAYRPADGLSPEIPWRVRFHDNGDEAGFESDELSLA